MDNGDVPSAIDPTGRVAQAVRAIESQIARAPGSKLSFLPQLPRTSQPAPPSHSAPSETAVSDATPAMTGDESNMSPLHRAALNGELGKVRELLAAGADIKEVGEGGRTAMHYAARGGNTEIIAELARRAPDLIHTAADDGTTPLHQAAAFGGAGAVKKLLDLGADIWAKKDGMTAMHHAAEVGNIQTIAELYRKAPDLIHTADNCGATPLHQAAAFGGADAVKKLVALGAIIQTKNKGGMTAMHYAAYEGRIDVIAELHERGDALIRSANEEGLTPLHVAAFCGRGDAVKKLLALGADIGAKTNDGKTVIYVAAAGGHTDVAALLLKRGAPIPEKGSELRKSLAALEPLMRHLEVPAPPPSLPSARMATTSVTPATLHAKVRGIVAF